MRNQDQMTEAEKEAYEERAAIIEFDAGVPRKQAEALAWIDRQKVKKREGPCLTTVYL